MNFRKIASLLLAVLMLCSALCACQPEQNNSVPGTSSSAPADSKANTALYQVTVIGADGKPATSGVVVRFMQNGEQVAMQSMDANGVATKELEKGDYTVELKFTNSDVSYYYDTSDLTLTKTKTQLTIHLCLEQSKNGEQVTAGDVEYTAYPLYTGNTYVTLKPGRNYFLFAPTQAGEYEFFTKDKHVVGYYGSVFYIMSNNAGKPGPENGTALSLAPGMVSGDNTFVIGIDNNYPDEVKTIVYATRVSDYIDTSIPTETYKTTAALTPWTMPAGKQIKKFDVAAVVPYKLVKDETTGFYHLNSVTGPLVVVFLGKNAKQHMSVLTSYAEILENSGVSAYFQDENGTYTKREIYNDCLMDYIGSYDPNHQNPDGSMGGYAGGCMDQKTGLYPLTDDLMHIIKEHGRSSGWWDADDERYIFGDETVNEENAWLFMCGYLG